MTKGGTVKVYPHGSPKQAANGLVLMLSGNQRAILVAFADKPPFCSPLRDGVMIHPEHGIIMMLGRYDVGPWIEAIKGGHYEIEDL